VKAQGIAQRQARGEPPRQASQQTMPPKRKADGGAAGGPASSKKGKAPKDASPASSGAAGRAGDIFLLCCCLPGAGTSELRPAGLKTRQLNSTILTASQVSIPVDGVLADSGKLPGACVWRDYAYLGNQVISSPTRGQARAHCPFRHPPAVLRRLARVHA
jgi:hypothetical protein